MRNRCGALDFSNRRSFLRATGLGMAAAPFIPLLEAQAEAAPQQRLVIMVGSNGIGNVSQFYPTGDTTNFTMGSTTKSLEPLKQHLICFGSEFDGRIDGGPIPHPESAANLLTATDPDSPPESQDPETRNNGTRATGPSVDQVIAKQIGKGTRFESLALGCGSISANLLGGSIVYRGSKDPIVAELDAFVTFDRLFPNIMAPPTTPGTKGPRDGDDAVLFDAVAKGVGSIRKRVGAEDARRLDAHLDSINSLRTRLATMQQSGGGTSGVGCVAPMTPPRDNNSRTFQTKNPAIFLKEIMQVNVDMAVAAMACDLTRVVVFQVGATTALWPPAFMALRQTLHEVSHQDPTGMTRYTAFTIEHGFKYLLDKMKASTDGTSTLLDSSAVFWSNEFADGNAHSMKSLPIIAAGGAGGKWKTGRFLRFGRRRRHVDFLVSLCRTFGLNVNTFGQDPTAGPIAELGV